MTKARNLVMVGTKKGAFIFESGDGRKTWRSSGPHFKGIPIYHVAFDPRQKKMFAAVNNDFLGSRVATSKGLGRTWKEGKKPPRFAKGSDWTMKRIWHFEPGAEEEPDVVYCGVDPASLFRSKDGGETWALDQGLYGQETRPKWNPGAGGLCLHSILVDPRGPRHHARGDIFGRDTQDHRRERVLVLQEQEPEGRLQPEQVPRVGPVPPPPSAQPVEA